MKRLSLWMALGAVSACAIDIPHIGYTRDPQGMVRAIDGIAGNFLLSDPVAADEAVAFAWNGTVGIRKTQTSIEGWNGAAARSTGFDAPAGAVVIGFDRTNSQTAWIYSRSTHALFVMTPSQSSGPSGMIEVPVDVAPGEEVLALAGGRDSVDIAVKSEDGVFVATFDRASGTRIAESALGVPRASHILLLQDGSILGVTGSTIWLRRMDGSQWSTESGVQLRELAWMGREWIQLTGIGRQLALRIRAGSDPVLYTIPQLAVTQ
jgi:hypothetical protein